MPAHFIDAFVIATLKLSFLKIFKHHQTILLQNLIHKRLFKNKRKILGQYHINNGASIP